MGLTPHAFVTWQGPTHAHLVPMGDGRVCVLETEEAAELLADAVANCSPDRHNGHGLTHNSDDVEAAYKGAIEQIQAKDFEAEWYEQERLRRVHKRWGGQVPEVVLMPEREDPEKWIAIVPDKEGTPYVYDVRKGTVQDIIPPPVEGKNAIRGEFGWRTKRRPLDRRIRRKIQRQLRDGQSRN